MGWDDWAWFAVAPLLTLFWPGGNSVAFSFPFPVLQRKPDSSTVYMTYFNENNNNHPHSIVFDNAIHRNQ